MDCDTKNLNLQSYSSYILENPLVKPSTPLSIQQAPL